MKALVVFVVLVLGAGCFPHSSKSDLGDLLTLNSEMSAHNLGIYDGNSTTMNTHRYLVGVLKDGSYLCAGIIVSSSWVVTLGDCTKSATAANLTIVASSTDGVTGRSHTVLQIVQHPDYGTKTLDYDFSCVQINGTFYYGSKRAHKLPSAQPKDYSTLTVAGYGCTTSSCTERTLRKASMLWMPKDKCSTTYSSYNLVWDRLGCAYNPEGSTLCKGDFGDAFVKGEVFYGLFASISSIGFCTTSAEPAILADVYPVADWIRNVTGAK